MAKLKYAVSQAGPEVPILIGLDGAQTSALVAAGQAVPAPVQARGLLDIGSTVSANAPWIFGQLGLLSKGVGSSYTAGGQIAVQLYHVSLSILPSRKTTPTMTFPTVWARALAVSLPDADVLVGLNVLLQGKLTLDGPRRTFSLQF